MNGFLSPRDKPLIIAHRGASADAPENTLAAFELAIAQGADAIECDVQFTRDRHLVIMHDFTLNRTTNGRGKVRHCTLAELRQLDAGQGQKIPTLEEVLDRFGHQTLIHLELKNWTTPGNGLEAAVTALVARKGLTNRVMFGSFLPWAGRTLQHALPEAIFCALYFPRWNEFMTWPFTKSIAVYGPHRKELTHHQMRAIHRRGKLINMWVVDDKFEQRELAKLGVDMITTNHPGAAKLNITSTLKAAPAAAPVEPEPAAAQ